nr:MAG TPA: hypothetical protein [Caudoviricetes sp.]
MINLNIHIYNIPNTCCHHAQEWRINTQDEASLPVVSCTASGVGVEQWRRMSLLAQKA